MGWGRGGWGICMDETSVVCISGGDGGVSCVHVCVHKGRFRYLDGGASGVPERARDTVAEGDVGGLEEGGGPRPLRDDHGGGEADLDGATGGVELLGGDLGADVLSCEWNEQERGDGE